MKMINPKEIWLQPWCDECEHIWRVSGVMRHWSAKSDEFRQCGKFNCGAKPVKYVLDQQEDE